MRRLDVRLRALGARYRGLRERVGFSRSRRHRCQRRGRLGQRKWQRFRVRVGGGSGPGSGSGSSSGGTDAATEAGDATADAEGGATIYNDMTQASFWSAFDLANVGVSSTGAGFHGAAFDGRYVYFLPWATGVVARYDTQGSFTALSSWATYSANSSDSGASGFFGATFDGRYLYLVPNVNGGVTRYDTQGSFTAASSWSIFDATSVNSGANGFMGLFDGKYVFFVPNYNGVGDGLSPATTRAAPSKRLRPGPRSTRPRSMPTPRPSTAERSMAVMCTSCRTTPTLRGRPPWSPIRHTGELHCRSVVGHL